jgi:hypothetical protein
VECKTSPTLTHLSGVITLHLAALTTLDRVTVVSTVRLYYILRIYYIKVEDRHYSIGFVCGSVELNLAIVTASIPTLWPLGRKWFPSFFASLGANRPHLYPDIEVAYATTRPRTSRTSRKYKSKIVWKDKRASPIEGDSTTKGGGSSGWDRLPDLPDRHLFAKGDHAVVDDGHHLLQLAGEIGGKERQRQNANA